MNGECNESVVADFSPLNKFHIEDKGAEESEMGVYWVTDGFDLCLVGFLPRKVVRMKSF